MSDEYPTLGSELPEGFIIDEPSYGTDVPEGFVVESPDVPEGFVIEEPEDEGFFNFSKLGDAFTSGAQLAGTGLAQAVGGLISNREEASPFMEKVESYLPGLRQVIDNTPIFGPGASLLLPSGEGTGTSYGRSLYGAAEDYAQDVRREANINPNSVAGYTQDLLPGVTNTLLATAAPTVGVPLLLGGINYGQNVGRNLADGAEADRARAGASIGSTATALTSTFALPFYQRGGSVVGSALGAGAAEGLTGALEERAQIAGEEYATGRTYSPREVVDRVSRSALLQGLSAGGAAGVRQAGYKLSSRLNKLPDGVDTDVYQQMSDLSEVRAAPRDTSNLFKKPEPIHTELRRVLDLDSNVTDSAANIPQRSGIKLDSTTPRPIPSEGIDTSAVKPEVSKVDRQLIQAQKELQAHTEQKAALAQRVKNEFSRDVEFVDASGEVKTARVVDPIKATPEKIESISNEFTTDLMQESSRAQWDMLADPNTKLTNPDGSLVDALMDPIKEFAQQFRPVKGAKISDPVGAQKFFQSEGAVTSFMPQVLKDVVGGIREGIIFPKTIAGKFKEFLPTFETARLREEAADRNVSEVSKRLMPYFDVVGAGGKSAAKVNKVLEMGRLHSIEGGRETGTRFVMSRENLAQLKIGGERLNPREIRAVMSAREGLDYSFDLLGDSYRRAITEDTSLSPVQKQEQLGKLEGHLQQLYAENYVPLGRQGEYFVTVRDRDGNPAEFLLARSKAEANKMTHKLAKKYPQKEGYSLPERGRFQDADEIGGQLPANLSARLGELDPEAIQGLIKTEQANGRSYPGFQKHLLRARGVPGYSKDFGSSIADYVMNLSRHAAKVEYKGKFKNALEQIDANKQPKLRAYAEKYQNYLNSAKGEWGAARQFLAFNYLGFNLKSAGLNATQSITTTYPLISKYSKGAEYIYGKAWKKSADYIANKNGFAKKNPELSAAIDDAISSGVATAKQLQEMAGYRNSVDGAKSQLQTLSDMSMAVFSTVEQGNRIHAFISGWEAWAGAKKRLKGEALEEFNQRWGKDRKGFAANFVDESQFIYSKTNRPQIARGKVGSLAFTFRTFSGNWIRLLRDNFNWENKQVATRLLATIGAMGGLGALPGYSLLQNIGIAMGNDPKSAIREGVEAASDSELYQSLPEAIKDKLPKNYNVADMLLYGAPILAGYNFSGALSVLQLPDNEQSGWAAASRFMAGAAGDIPARAARAFDRFKTWPGSQTEGIQRALEAVMPEFARNANVASRWYLEEEYTGPRSDALISRPPSLGETIGKGVGFTPTSLALKSEEFQIRKIAKDAYAAAREGVYRSFAKAITDNDPKLWDRMMSEVEQHNLEHPTKPIRLTKKKIMEYLKDPKERAMKYTPKDIRGEVAEKLRRLERD